MKSSVTVLVLFASMLGMAVGLLGVLIVEPLRIPAGSTTREISISVPTAELGSSSIHIAGGELVMVVATIPPTPWPTNTPGSVSVATRSLASCDNPTPGEECEWPQPTFAPPTVPICETAIPGTRCVWPMPTSGALPDPPIADN